MEEWQVKQTNKQKRAREREFRWSDHETNDQSFNKTRSVKTLMRSKIQKKRKWSSPADTIILVSKRPVTSTRRNSRVIFSPRVSWKNWVGKQTVHTRTWRLDFAAVSCIAFVSFSVHVSDCHCPDSLSKKLKLIFHTSATSDNIGTIVPPFPSPSRSKREFYSSKFTGTSLRLLTFWPEEVPVGPQRSFDPQESFGPQGSFGQKRFL